MGRVIEEFTGEDRGVQSARVSRWRLFPTLSPRYAYLRKLAMKVIIDCQVT